MAAADTAAAFYYDWLMGIFEIVLFGCIFIAILIATAAAVIGIVWYLNRDRD